jgi:hypothetical protein
MTPETTSVPNLHSTGLGYETFRCRAGDANETLYVQQLLACVEHDPHLVFADHTYVGRDLELPWLNTLENLELRYQWHEAVAD